MVATCSWGHMMLQNYLCSVSHFLDSRSIMCSENANEGENSVSWRQSPRSQSLLMSMPAINFLFSGGNGFLWNIQLSNKVINGGSLQPQLYFLQFSLEVPTQHPALVRKALVVFIPLPGSASPWISGEKALLRSQLLGRHSFTFHLHDVVCLRHSGRRFLLFIRGEMLLHYQPEPALPAIAWECFNVLSGRTVPLKKLKS